MSKKILALVRFFKKEVHRDAFLRGELYMNRLKFFKAYEEQEACNIGDVHEGTTGWYQPEGIKLTIKNNDTGEEHLITDFAGPVLMGLNRHNDYHVYCLSAIWTDDDLKFETFEQLRSHTMLDLEKGDLGDYCVIFTTRDFFDRLDVVLKAEVESGHVVGRGLVEYFDPDTFSGSFEGDQAIMRKKSGFSHQKEYRIFIYNGTSGDDARSVNIGDLTDIAFVCDKKDIHKLLQLVPKE